MSKAKSVIASIDAIVIIPAAISTGLINRRAILCHAETFRVRAETESRWMSILFFEMHIGNVILELTRQAGANVQEYLVCQRFYAVTLRNLQHARNVPAGFQVLDYVNRHRFTVIRY